MGEREFDESSTAHPKSSVNIAKQSTWLATWARKSELDTNTKCVIHFVGHLFFLQIRK